MGFEEFLDGLGVRWGASKLELEAAASGGLVAAAQNDLLGGALEGGDQSQEAEGVGGDEEAQFQGADVAESAGVGAFPEFD